MRASYLWLVLLLVAAAGTSQAVIDGAIGDVYPQNDGGSGQDASDTCSQPFPEVPRNERQEGQLVPVLDHDDFWAIPADAGERLRIEVRPGGHGTAGLNATAALTVVFWATEDETCPEKLAETTTDGQEPATFQVEVPKTGVYSLQVHLDGLSTDINGDTPGLVTSQSGHCSPFCLTDMDLLVTAG